MKYIEHGAIIASPLLHPSAPIIIYHTVTKQIGDVVGGKKGLLISDKCSGTSFPDLDLIQSVCTASKWSVYDIIGTQSTNKNIGFISGSRDVEQGVLYRDKTLWYVNDEDIYTSGAIEKALELGSIQETTYRDAISYFEDTYAPTGGFDTQLETYRNQLIEVGKIESLVFQVRNMTKGMLLAVDLGEFDRGDGMDILQDSEKQTDINLGGIMPV